LREREHVNNTKRGDYESKTANLKTFFSPAVAPETVVDDNKDFAQVSPQFSLVWHMVPGKTVYGTIGRGYRAGGFNPVSPAGSEAYGEETSWSYEIGSKTSWFDDKLTLQAAAFYISWRDLQLNLPVGQNYYIDNAGDADSKGVELELNARPLPGWDAFGSVGYTDARFRGGASSIHTDAFGVNSTVDVGGNRLIYAPEFTANAGTQYAWSICPGVTVFARADVVGYGRYFYNAANTASQKPYSLGNFRAGARGQRWFVEGWVKNAFDAKYVPVAFEFPNFQSGFLGENGAPVTFGVHAGLNF
jgi:iron complex outermembrane receptor protein